MVRSSGFVLVIETHKATNNRKTYIRFSAFYQPKILYVAVTILRMRRCGLCWNNIRSCSVRGADSGPSVDAYLCACGSCTTVTCFSKTTQLVFPLHTVSSTPAVRTSSIPRCHVRMLCYNTIQKYGPGFTLLGLYAKQQEWPQT